jgi:hypothetical protein
MMHLHLITFSCYRRHALRDSARRRDLLLRVLEKVRRRYQFVVVGYVVNARTCSSADQRAGEKEFFNCDTGHRDELHATGVGRAAPPWQCAAGEAIRARSVAGM